MIPVFLLKTIKMLSLKYSKSFLASSIASVFCDTTSVSTNSMDLKHSGTKTRQKSHNFISLQALPGV